MRIVVPPPALCTDNAAMIAWAGMEMYTGGWHTDLDVLAISKWPMDPDRGEGIMEETLDEMQLQNMKDATLML
uniref:Gcp-like domain-containing protein n=1 Tax=Bionectria ochroleuca TaxID=29856 RepID=A0A0B7JP96_BIOOC